MAGQSFKGSDLEKEFDIASKMRSMPFEARKSVVGRLAGSFLKEIIFNTL